MKPRRRTHALPEELPQTPEHGDHTLRVWRGVVVGRHGSDVFVELGPRMQGVIALRHFDAEPREGQEFDFTLRGREEGLWVLARAGDPSLPTWESMEVGSIVQARAVRVSEGGLEVKIGKLHGFLPRSQSGLDRDEPLAELVGKVLPCQVIEVEVERQRCVVSRKLVEQRERESDRQRFIARLEPGRVVQGRVTRIEEYGAFVALGPGVEGLAHISNLAHERVAHPSEVVRVGESRPFQVLHVKHGGRRIALGLKQVGRNPWRDVERRLWPGQLVEGVVALVRDFGAFVAIARGVEALLPASQAGLRGGQGLTSLLQPGETISVRVLEMDVERERMTVSLLHADGRRIAADEAANQATFDELLAEASPAAGQELGRLLRRALGQEPGEIDQEDRRAG